MRKTRNATGVMLAAIMLASSAPLTVNAMPGGMGGGPGFGPPDGVRQGPGLSRGPRRHHGPPPITRQLEKLKELGVSDDQIQVLKDLEYEMGLERVDLKAGVEKAELSLRQQMESEAPDHEAVLELVEELNTARGEMFRSHIEMQLKVREVVGADVIQKLRPERKHR